MLKEHPLHNSFRGCVYFHSFSLGFKLVGYWFSSAVLPRETGTFMRVELGPLGSPSCPQGQADISAQYIFNGFVDGYVIQAEIEHKRALRHESKAMDGAIFWAAQDPLGATLGSASRALPAGDEAFAGGTLLSPKCTHIASTGIILCMPLFPYG